MRGSGYRIKTRLAAKTSVGALPGITAKGSSRRTCRNVPGHERAADGATGTRRSGTGDQVIGPLLHEVRRRISAASAARSRAC